MMPDQLARQEQIARRLEQSKRLLRGANDPTTSERIGKLIDDLELEKMEEAEQEGRVVPWDHGDNQMQNYVINENITRYRKLIAISEGDPRRDEDRYQTLLRLLAEEQAKAVIAR